MKVIRARVLGFCMGVRRAVEIAWQASSSITSEVYTMGPLIHNPSVLESLEKRGLICLGEGEIPPDVDLPTSDFPAEKATVIIRAHGVSPVIQKELVRRGQRILDATCPHVKVSQEKARSFAEKGYRIFLAGEKNHAEIAGIQSYVEEAVSARFSRCFVAANPDEAEAAAAELFRLGGDGKTVLIGQTTISSEEYRAIAKAVMRYFPSLEILDTICGAAVERQEALRELCSQVDAVIIAGGRGSSNTQRLLSLARELGKPGWIAETQADIPAEIRNYAIVGLSAGASTPESIIDEIEKEMSKY